MIKSIKFEKNGFVIDWSNDNDSPMVNVGLKVEPVLSTDDKKEEE